MKPLTVTQRVMIVVTTVSAALGGIYTAYQFGYDAGYNIGKLEAMQSGGSECEKKLKRCKQKLRRNTDGR